MSYMYHDFNKKYIIDSFDFNANQEIVSKLIPPPIDTLYYVLNKNQNLNINIFGQIIPCHRGTSLGNTAYKITNYKDPNQRKIAIERFDFMFKTELESGACLDKIRQLNTILEMGINAQDNKVYLSCYCKPKDCHVDVIVRFLKNYENWYWANHRKDTQRNFNG